MGTSIIINKWLTIGHTECCVGKDLFQRMIRTLGIGFGPKKKRLWAFGIGPPAEIVLCFCVFYHYTTHTHNTRISLFSSGFHCFSTRTHMRAHTHTCNRPLSCAWFESVCVNTRKNHEIRLKKAKSGETPVEARFDFDGQIVRLRRRGERRIEPSGSWFLLKFLSFRGKGE